MTVNIYASNTRASKQVGQILVNIKVEIDSNTIIVGRFNAIFTSMNSPSRQKSSNETQTLKNALDQMDLIDFYRAFQPESNTVHILFKGTWNILQDR